jgi:hypothetical protein
MGKIEESFEDELAKLAKIVEIIEDSFISTDDIEIELKVPDDKFKYLSQNLRYQNQEKVTITIDNVSFTFLKK